MCPGTVAVFALYRRGVVALGRGGARGVTRLALTGPPLTGPPLTGPPLVGSGVASLLIAGTGGGTVGACGRGIALRTGVRL
ncbi:hypothetical protein, partial [Microbispora rosea]|uniref:hypothetical protein n=1 Tax=Microbispora rosea TaxID=58117 RepID=UPI0019526105